MSPRRCGQSVKLRMSESDPNHCYYILASAVRPLCILDFSRNLTSDLFHPEVYKLTRSLAGSRSKRSLSRRMSQGRWPSFHLIALPATSQASASQSTVAWKAALSGKKHRCSTLPLQPSAHPLHRSLLLRQVQHPARPLSFTPPQ
jgi:hypothetical protein